MRFWWKFSKNFDFAQIFKKDFDLDQISKNSEFGQNFE